MKSKLRTTLGVLSLCLAGCEAAMNPPQDREVRALFAAHRVDFEKIRDMLLADSVSAIQLSPGPARLFAPDVGWSELQGSPNREERYVRFMQSVGVSRVDHGWGRPRGNVAFTMYSFGNVADSYIKRIVYSPTPLAPLRPDTDTSEFKRDNSVVYAEIGDGWYIEKERD